jgi:ankyrin repeat protein
LGRWSYRVTKKTWNNGQNALHIASLNGHKEMVKLLMEQEMDINQTIDDARKMHLKLMGPISSF